MNLQRRLSKEKVLTPQEEFLWCQNLEPVTEIGDLAFACCDNLETFGIPESVERIGVDAFDSDYGLVLSVTKGGMAETYAKANGLRYSYG